MTHAIESAGHFDPACFQRIFKILQQRSLTFRAIYPVHVTDERINTVFQNFLVEVEFLSLGLPLHLHSPYAMLLLDRIVAAKNTLVWLDQNIPLQRKSIDFRAKQLLISDLEGVLKSTHPLEDVDAIVHQHIEELARCVPWSKLVILFHTAKERAQIITRFPPRAAFERCRKLLIQGNSCYPEEYMALQGFSCLTELKLTLLDITPYDCVLTALRSLTCLEMEQVSCTSEASVALPVAVKSWTLQNSDSSLLQKVRDVAWGTLMALVLEGLNLTLIPNEISYASALKILSLSHNFFQDIPNSVLSVEALKELNFSKNMHCDLSLRTIERRQVTLTQLDLTDTPVFSFEALCFMFPRLEVLEVTARHCRSLPPLSLESCRLRIKEMPKEGELQRELQKRNWQIDADGWVRPCTSWYTALARFSLGSTP